MPEVHKEDLGVGGSGSVKMTEISPGRQTLLLTVDRRDRDHTNFRMMKLGVNIEITLLYRENSLEQNSENLDIEVADQMLHF